MLAFLVLLSLFFERKNAVIRNRQPKISAIKILIAMAEKIDILFDLTINTLRKAIIPERIKNSSASEAEGIRIFL